MSTSSERYKELDGGFQKAVAAGDDASAQVFANDMKAEAAKPDPTLIDRNIEFAQNFGKGAIGRLGDVGRSVIDIGERITPAIAGLKAAGVEMPWKDYMRRSGEISKQMQDESGVAGMLGGGAVDLAATGGLGGIVRGALPRAVAASRGAAPLVATAEGVGAGAYLSPDDRTMGAATGGVGGLVGQQLFSRTLGKIANPLRTGRYHPSEVLLDEGVPLTVGQAANPNTFGGSALRSIEETLATNPLGGQLIKSQREGANRAFRDIPLQAAAERAGIPVPSRAGGQTARQMANETRQEAGAAIERELTGRSQRMTGVLQRNIDRILDNPRGPMTPEDRASVRGVVEEQLFDRFNDPVRVLQGLGNQADLAQVFRAQATMRGRAFKLMNSDDLSKQAQGHALVRVSDEVLDFIGRRYPAVRPRIERVREAYPDIMTVRAATRKAGATGEFMPEHLSKAAEQSHNADLQNWAEMAAPILTKDPGRLSNYARLAMLASGTGGLGYFSEDPWLTGATIGIPTLALGTRFGQRALTGRFDTQRQLANMLQRQGANDLMSGLGREIALEIGD